MEESVGLRAAHAGIEKNPSNLESLSINPGSPPTTSIAGSVNRVSRRPPTARDGIDHRGFFYKSKQQNVGKNVPSNPSPIKYRNEIIIIIIGKAAGRRQFFCRERTIHDEIAAVTTTPQRDNSFLPPQDHPSNVVNSSTPREIPPVVNRNEHRGIFVPTRILISNETKAWTRKNDDNSFDNSLQPTCTIEI